MVCCKESAPDDQTHHSNLATPDSGFWKRELAFHDYLRAHPESEAELVAPKRRLAEEYTRTQQVDREGKIEYVTRVLELANLFRGHRQIDHLR